MTDEPEIVELMRAKTPFEARIIVTVLEEAGVSAYVEGGNLQDEFAASQRLMNTGSVKVFVHHDRVEEANEAIAEARRVGEHFKELPDEDGPVD